MTDEQLERVLRAALQRDDPGPVPDELRRRIATIPDGVGAPRRTRLFAASGQVVSVAAAVAVILAGTLVALILFGQRAGVGPSPSATPSLSPGPSASVTSSPAPSVTSAGPVTVPLSGSWSGLRWSAPATFPSPLGFDTLVMDHGTLYAIGQVDVGAVAEVAVWRSSDGLRWTLLTQEGAPFASAGVLSLLATPTGLVAWGQDGEPVCSAPGAGQTCGPVPQMVWTSHDGVTWTKATDFAALAGASIGSMTSGSAGLVAAGADQSGAPAVWTSPTGASWSRESLSASLFPSAAFSDVRATATGYVLAGAVNVTRPYPWGVAAAWWSVDGRTWTRVTVSRQSGLGVSLGQVFVGADGLVAVGTATPGSKTGTAWSSTDGSSWTPMVAGYEGAPSPAPGLWVLPSFVIFDDGSHLVATDLGTETMTWWSSTDGTTWQRLALSGLTSTAPVWPGDQAKASRWFDHAFVVPGGLVVIGTGNGSPTAPGRVWAAAAQP